MPKKPMLAGKCTDTSTLKYPVLISRKLDGVRCSMQGGVLLSRTLKPIPNVHVQAMFKGLPEGTDGELIAGDPLSKDENGNSNCYRKTTHVVMSDDNPADDVNLHVFDKIADQGFRTRLELAYAGVQGFKHVRMVEHICCNNEAELLETEERWLAEGNEGLMIRSYEGPYKHGRTTKKQGWLLKLKRYEDSEAEVIGTYELQHNGNEEFINELGRTARSSCKAGKTGLDTLGGFYVRGLGKPYVGVEFKVGNGPGLTQAMRKEFWDDREAAIGRIVKYKYFPIGAKDKPRHPLFLGWRDKRDM